MIDTHAHLNHEKLFENRKEIVENAVKNGVDAVVCIGYDFASSQKACEIANEFDNVYAVIGVHPHDAKTYSDEVEKQLISLAKSKKVVAIGEIGLDFFYDFSDRETQKKVFVKQLELADKLNLPVVIHTRDAQNETLQILKENADLLKHGGIMHCFSGDLDFAKSVIDLGFVLGIGGTLTFKNSLELENVVKNVPLEKIVTETDCPYLTPVPFRGKNVNEPKFIPIIVEKLAEILGVDAKIIEEQTTKNAKRVYKI